MIIKKKQQVIELEAILEKLTARIDSLPVTPGDPVAMQYINNGVLFHCRENHRYVRCIVNPDYDGISLELGLDQTKDDLKVVMSILNNSQTSEAADQIYIWFNVNTGYLFDVAETGYSPAHSINRNCNGIYRTAFKVDK